MEYRTLGRTGLDVSPLSMGGLFVSKIAGEDRRRAYDAVHRALELGVNYTDTAPSYLDSEEVLGEALEGVAQPCVISTKLGGKPEPFDARNVDQLKYSFAESLRLLKREAVDILMVHEPDRPGQYDWWTDFQRAEGPVWDLLVELKKTGTIRYTGLGGTTAYEIVPLIRTGKFDVVLTAFNYSLLWREAALEVLPAAKQQNMGIVIGSPLQQGALARRYDQEIRSGAPWLSGPRRRQYLALYAFLDEAGLPLPEAGMRFVISNPAVHTVLMGARSAAEVEQNTAAISRGPLPDDVLRRLDEIAARVPFRPFGEPFGLGWALANPTGYKGLGMA